MTSSGKIQELQEKIRIVEHDTGVIKKIIRLCNKNMEESAKKSEDQKLAKLLGELE